MAGCAGRCVGWRFPDGGLRGGGGCLFGFFQGSRIFRDPVMDADGQGNGCFRRRPEKSPCPFRIFIPGQGRNRGCLDGLFRDFGFLIGSGIHFLPGGHFIEERFFLCRRMCMYKARQKQGGQNKNKHSHQNRQMGAADP